MPLEANQPDGDFRVLKKWGGVVSFPFVKKKRVREKNGSRKLAANRPHIKHAELAKSILQRLQLLMYSGFEALQRQKKQHNKTKKKHEKSSNRPNVLYFVVAVAIVWRI